MTTVEDDQPPLAALDVDADALPPSDTATATFGMGCFWGPDARFGAMDAVVRTRVGYAGGTEPDPSYYSLGDHTEVVQVEYDPATLGYDDLLEVFFATHDPTQLNRQGPDVGSQYRSIVLHHDDEQRRQAEAYVEALDEEYDDDVVTEIESLERFWAAEEYHQDYFEKNPNDAYCRMHAQPKVEKVRERFASKVSQ